MKKFFAISLLVLTSCGYEVIDSEMVGQVKKVSNQTPLICSDRVDADVSLGVMRNGVGSMSTEDVWLTVPNQNDQEALKNAQVSGKLVRVKYDVARLTFCWNNYIVKSVEVLKE